jgi:fucose permease
MWFVLRQRAARPDAPYWPGRRFLAAIDAVAWPTLVVVASMCLPAHGVVVGAVLVAACVIAAARRLRQALWRNHRYRFTTWRFGRAALVLIVFGALLRWLVLA